MKIDQQTRKAIEDEYIAQREQQYVGKERKER